MIYYDHSIMNFNIPNYQISQLLLIHNHSGLEDCKSKTVKQHRICTFLKQNLDKGKIKDISKYIKTNYIGINC